ncbi:deoxynucleoside kinase [Apis laboriosa]|uniref:Deoxynucleoside kinase n=1 Tax=Apis mellifera TaxID=7460 RepID=A0A7M7LT45_APIME|nr:deoxynucleoside kinase [Apis mellifera]XP_043792588.1 deoxynucleoside kinase [Apis laboriosa]KAG6804180.1 deoxynucleoside kinase [Apis mellifera caucasica]KAG9433662.1 deoxynucleoside kinase [Apis mellifera carnica]|eukprot:XP_006570297.1 deoxynucleoside kinase [Apis mellifera]
MNVIAKTVFMLKMTTSICKMYKRPFTVCIEGNIGSGKTTFLSHFKEFNNTTVLQEPVELWRNVGGTNLLELMYTDPKRYSFLFQSYVQLTMLQLHTYKSLMPYKIMERSVFSSRCFIENMKRKKLLHDVEVVILEDWYDWCIENADIETDLIVYLRTSPDVVYHRMKTRARKEESLVSLEYLKQLHNIHDEWLYYQTLFTVPAPVLVLDGNKNLEEMVKEFENCKDQIYGKKETEKN